MSCASLSLPFYITDLEGELEALGGADPADDDFFGGGDVGADAGDAGLGGGGEDDDDWGGF